MIVTSTGIVNGIIEDKYGKRGSQFNENGMPTYSLPLKIEDAPEGTKSFALVLEDKDAFPVTGGFSWIHWTAANITRNELLENECHGFCPRCEQLHEYPGRQTEQSVVVLLRRYGAAERAAYLRNPCVCPEYAAGIGKRLLLQRAVPPDGRPCFRSGHHQGDIQRLKNYGNSRSYEMFAWYYLRCFSKEHLF